MTVEEKADKFVKYWNEYLKINSVLLLDYSWPSISVIDLLTFSCRYKKDLPQALSEMLSGASAYIAVVAKNCFEESGYKVNLLNTKDESEDRIEVVLNSSDKKETRIALEKLFRARLKELPNPFPVSEDFETPITFEAPVLSLFCISIFTANTPDVDLSLIHI